MALYAFALIYIYSSLNRSLIIGTISKSTNVALPFSVLATLIIAREANSLIVLSSSSKHLTNSLRIVGNSSSLSPSPSYFGAIA